MKWIKAAKQLYPAITCVLSEYTEELREWGNKVNSPVIASVHRDFYDKQILIDNRSVYFLDFDSVAIGDPVIDLGNFVAHLILRGVQYYDDPDFYLALIQKFIQAYTEQASDDLEERIDLYTTSSLFRLACVYLLRPDGNRLFYPLLWQGKQRIPCSK